MGWTTNTTVLLIAAGTVLSFVGLAPRLSDTSASSSALAAPGQSAPSSSVSKHGGADKPGRADLECKHPSVEKRCEDGWCTVPAGCFVMGAPRTASYAASVSDVQVEVHLTHGFVVGQTEVTRAQWLKLGLPDPEVDWRRAGSSEADLPAENFLPTCTDPQCPVVWVGFEDALAYTNLLSDREGLPRCYELSDCQDAPGKNLRCHSIRVTSETPYLCRGYRLPTQAEWEYAARAGTKTAFHSGDMVDDREVSSSCGLDPNLDSVGWYCHNSGAPAGKRGGAAHPVAKKLANAWGLFDTSGNALEWVNDIHDPRGYGEGPLTDPVGGVEDPQNLTPGRHPVHKKNLDSEGYVNFRVARGGSFSRPAVNATASARGNYSTRCAGQDTGFRVVRSLGVDD